MKSTTCANGLTGSGGETQVLVAKRLSVQQCTKEHGEHHHPIKDAQPDLFGTRASCSSLIANEFRLRLAALAYTLMPRLRALDLQSTECERASAATIRVWLLKIGAATQRNTRHVRVMLAIHHPLRVLFATAASKLAALGQ
jgi:hypothetical protein